MSRRVLGVALTAVVVAIALFAVPLALAARQLFLADEQAELERAALRAVVSVDPAFAQGDPVELPATKGGVLVTLYGSDGRRVSGPGPSIGGAPVNEALTGRVVQREDAGVLIAAVPVSSEERVIGVVTASVPTSSVWLRTLVTWGGMVALATVAIAVAVVVARRQARQLNRPLEELSDAARRLGEGDFSVRTGESGVPEIDETGAALNLTAARLGDLVERERAFAANASHQLRTPLTGLRLGLESALDTSDVDLAVAAREAIASADELERTIDDLLALARVHGREPRRQPPVRAVDLLDGVRARWHETLAGAGRPLRLTAERGAPAADCSLAAARQVLDVLVDNAFIHGAGAVEVVARASGEVLAVDVRDEGVIVPTGSDIFERGWSGSGRHGIGLALARDLAQSQGGRLLLTRTSPSTVFTLLLPAALDAT